jgi:rod shape-determining protein MreC
MRKISYRPYLFLILFFLSLMSLPYSAAEKVRSGFVCCLAPSWQGLHWLKQKSVAAFSYPFSTGSSSTKSLEWERLEQENHLLRSQMQSVKEWLLNEERLEEQMTRCQWLGSQEPENKAFFQRRSQELCRSLDLQMHSLPATVIFREPASWSSTLWINVGEKDNVRLGMQVVGKNSPVLLGTSVIGVVEYIGKTQSKVCLITDARLVPSVRALRGNEQNRFLLEHLKPLVAAFQLRENLLASEQERTAVVQFLERLKQIIQRPSEEFYLAKGELRGTSHPMWRSRNLVLKGVGFNYDFPDMEGPARDLRSGQPYAPHQGSPVQLLSEGDLLVTTGFDGIFPAGLRVATVSHVQTLKEGASCYEIEAVSTAGNLDELSHVFVLAPRSFSSH